MIHRVSRVSSNRFLGEIRPSSGRKEKYQYSIENLAGKCPGSPEVSQEQGGQDDRQTDRRGGLRASNSDYKSKLPTIDTSYIPLP